MRSLPSECRAFLFVFAPFCASGLDAATSGYWSFEEGFDGVAAAGAILDSSGNANHGTPSGDPTYSSLTPADFPSANTLSLSFDGSGDVVAIPNSASLSGVGAFTVEFWMRSAGTGSGQDLLVDKSHGFIDSTGWLFQSQPGTGNIFFAVGLGGGGSVNFQGVVSSDDLFDDEWHHLAGTYDGSNVQLFVDGISQGSNNVGTYVGNTRDVRLGNTWQSSRFFSGELDELRISDEVLGVPDFLTVVPEPNQFTLVAGIAAMGLLFRRREIRK
ncbi:MAG: LamG domain-containing protein [Opitutaceae bacterium]